MDNFQIDVTSNGREDFVTVLRLAFKGAPGGKASSYAVHPTLGLVLRWTAAETDKKIYDVSLRDERQRALREQGKTWEVAAAAAPLDAGAPILPLPYPMETTAAIEFAWNWLAQASYGQKPDIDGDCKKGWRIFNEAWGHVGRDCYAFVAVRPTWALYGK